MEISKKKKPKKPCYVVLLLALLIPLKGFAEDSQDLMNLCGLPGKCTDVLAGNALRLDNGTYLKWRNAANNADISAIRVDSNDETVINSDAGDGIHLQIGGDADRILNLTAASDASTVMTWGSGGTVATQDFRIQASTADGDDDFSLILNAGGGYGPTRGPSILGYGNETASTGGSWLISGGAVSTGHIDLQLGNTSALFRYLNTSGTPVVTIDNTGNITSPGLFFPTANEEAVAGAGTTVADAAALSATKHIHQLTGANGTVGWKFATSVAGQFEFLLNTTAGVPKIYAASGGTCNGGAADAACTLVTGIVAHLCYSTAVNTWICA